jgi:hypothetical protein
MLTQKQIDEWLADVAWQNRYNRLGRKNRGEICAN